ncbi:hypothetical protein [Halopseudomonas yangmingensis]|uniref:Uncharacterized protein n=1 Tax=Halopseudomonas yangmingensis TaxID=1720063 RepID=A0A1I4NCR5_9GAMM|nr:hypothetical protein [Halopseudomonas yangmingensis]SFM13362.1 hypothetical protein SAMN05216217_101227 [Halopseudomonas yangmingensis]
MTDLTKLRKELRGLRRCDLLIIAERAGELVSKANLKPLLSDFMHVDVLVAPGTMPVPLIEEIQKFYSESCDGRYFEQFEANAKNYKEHSRGTDAFVAELDRLLRKCVQAVGRQPGASVREAFEFLFRLLRRIDEAPDDVVYFAEEAGSWQLGVNWQVVFPAYFRCLAEMASPEEFARTIDQMIRAFAEHERPLHLRTAHQVASAAQQAALRALSGTGG